MLQGERSDSFDAVRDDIADMYKHFYVDSVDVSNSAASSAR